MLTDLLTITAGALSGAVAGGLGAARHSSLRHRRRPALRGDTETIGSGDLFDEAEIVRAANHWATAHRRPDAVPLVARKLRLGLRLGNQPRRIQRRWVR